MANVEVLGNCKKTVGDRAVLNLNTSGLADIELANQEACIYSKLIRQGVLPGHLMETSGMREVIDMVLMRLAILSTEGMIDMSYEEAGLAVNRLLAASTLMRFLSVESGTIDGFAALLPLNHAKEHLTPVSTQQYSWVLSDAVSLEERGLPVPEHHVWMSLEEIDGSDLVVHARPATPFDVIVAAFNDTLTLGADNVPMLERLDPENAVVMAPYLVAAAE